MYISQLQRRDTSANWSANNPVLLNGEFGIETDTKRFKFGDGATAWNSLGYAVNGFNNPMTTEGDLIIEGSSAPERLPVGENNSVLTVVNGLPAWSAAGGGNIDGGSAYTGQFPVGNIDGGNA